MPKETQGSRPFNDDNQLFLGYGFWHQVVKKKCERRQTLGGVYRNLVVMYRLNRTNTC